MTKKILSLVLAACALFSIMSVPVYAGNTYFKFELRDKNSKESILGPATKDDGDMYAYITPHADKSNLAIQGAVVNLRVRDNARNYATEYVVCNAYRRYTPKYIDGKAVAGASYRLFANVESTKAYNVILGGLWCP